MFKAGKKSAAASSAVLSAFILILAAAPAVRADAEFDEMYSTRKYKEALAYAEEKLPYNKRDPQLWIKIGHINEALGFIEKALACYMVAWRSMSDDYNALYGIARVYNKMDQPEDAAAMAERALRVNFTAEASWEYAKACIALKKPADAKKALEKVIAADSSNVIANRELGNIYYTGGEYMNAIALMKRSYKEKPDGEVAFRIGRSYVEAGVPDSALVYLKIAVDRKSNVSEASRFIARARFGQKKYADVVSGYANVLPDIMDAMDFYMMAFAKEKTNDAAGATAAYKSAVAMFGNDKRKEALLARANLARAQLKSKAVSFAFPHLQFIVAADEKGAVVNDIYFLLAEAYVESKDTHKAISSLEKAISINSRNVEAYARLAELYEKNGQGDKAKKVYEQMMSVSPNDPKVFIALGNFSIKAKKWKDAVAMFEKANKIKETAPAFEGIAMAYFGSGSDMYKAAMEAAKSAIALDPDALEARAIIARVLIDSKNYKAAQEHAEILSKKSPTNLEYLRMLAECCEKNDAKAMLAVVDKQIMAIDRKDVTSRLRLAAAAEAKNDIKTAISMYRDIAALDNKDPRAHRRLATLFATQNQNAEAAACIKDYLKLRPGDAEAHRDLGDYLYNQKDLDGALNAYRAAIKLDPNIKGFHKRYAEIVTAKGQTAEVITALTGVIKSGDADVGTYTTLGLIYQGKGQYKDAMEMYGKAVKMEPSNVDALTALASCQAANGDIKAAIISYEQVVMMNASAAREYKDLGDLYAKQKKDDEALRCYAKYLDKVPTDKATSVSVGKIYYDQKKYAEAAKYISQAQSNDPATLIMYADASIQSGNPKNAQVALEELRSRKPQIHDIGRVLSMLGEMYEKDGKQSSAASAYADYVALPGVKDREASYKAAFLQEKSNPAAAIKIYEANLKAFPDDVRNALRLGLLYSQNKDTREKAVPLLQKSTAAADKDPKLWLDIAAVYGSMNRDADELAAYQKYLRKDPQHVAANKRVGALLMRKGDYSNAMISLEIANTMSPNDPDVMSLLAKGYLRTKRNKEAMAMLVKAKAAKPNDPEIRYQLYEIYTADKKPQEALAEIQELVKVSKDPRHLQLYGDALVALGNSNEAEGVINELLAKDPTDPNALMLRARLLRSKKDYEGALEIYKEVSDIQPDYALAHYERAETYVLTSKPTWAETFYNRALRADPKFALAELGLAKLYKARKQMDLYKEHLEAAQRLAPDNDLVIEEVKKAGN
jgi:tetratricopeptide (TPR) repeat protein